MSNPFDPRSPGDDDPFEQLSDSEQSLSDGAAVDGDASPKSYGKLGDEFADGMGSLGGSSLDAGSLGAQAFDDIEVQPLSPYEVQDAVEPPPELPANQATHECLRGPCEWFWHVIQRSPMQSEVIQIQRTMHCRRHQQIMSLADENVFACDEWWPQPMSFVPLSLRPALRPVIRDVWNATLKLIKYPNSDFENWKWWGNDNDAFLKSTDEIVKLRVAATLRARAEKEAEKKAREGPFDAVAEDAKIVDANVEKE